MTAPHAIAPKHHGVAALFAVLALCLTYIFRDAGGAIWQSWGQEEYSHGYLIPPLALLLLCNKMEDVKTAPRPSWVGFGIVFFALAVGALFYLSGIINALPQLYVIALIGLIILFLGTESLRTLSGALILLLFAAPLPKFFYYTLSSAMQTSSTSLGVTLLGLIGIPVFQDGNIIDLGSYKLNVVEACSGVRYLFPLLSLSFLLATLYKGPMWKRVLLFLSAPPFSVILNGFRIALIGVTVDHWGSQMAEGLLHDLEGLIVFIGGVLLLLLEIRLLQKIGRPGVLQLDALRIPSFRNLPRLTMGKPILACVFLIFIGTLTSAALQIFAPALITPVPLAHSFTQFPMQLQDWKGQPQSLPPQALKVLGTEDYLLADYTKINQQPVNLYVLYFKQQDSSSNEAVHSPTVCIPAGGWTVTERSKKILTINDPASAPSSPLAVNRLLIAKGTTKQIVYYWYAERNHSTTQPIESRFYTFLNSLTKGRSNGALIRIVTSIGPLENEAQAETRMNEFLQDNLPMLHTYMFGTP